jgi:hypothetical protein
MIIVSMLKNLVNDKRKDAGHLLTSRTNIELINCLADNASQVLSRDLDTPN